MSINNSILKLSNMKARLMIITNIFRKHKREYYTKYSTPQFT